MDPAFYNINYISFPTVARNEIIPTLPFFLQYHFQYTLNKTKFITIFNFSSLYLQLLCTLFKSVHFPLPFEFRMEDLALSIKLSALSSELPGILYGPVCP